MGLFQRITDIVSANLNELADGFENPEQMLRQAIREMEDSIVNATKETARAIANEKTIDRELDNNRAQVAKWKQRAEHAVKAGDDKLARKAISRKQENANVLAALEDQQEIASHTSKSLRRQLDAMKAKLAEAKRNLITLSARHRAAEFRSKLQQANASGGADLDQNAFVKFDRLREKVVFAEAEAEAYAVLTGDDSTGAKDIELESLFQPDTNAEIDEELAKMKKQLC